MKSILYSALCALTLLGALPGAHAQTSTASGCEQIQKTTNALAQQVHSAMVAWQYGTAQAPAFTQTHAQPLADALNAMRAHAISVRQLCQNTHERSAAPTAAEHWNILLARVQRVIAQHSANTNTVKQSTEPAVTEPSVQTDPATSNIPALPSKGNTP